MEGRTRRTACRGAALAACLLGLALPGGAAEAQQAQGRFEYRERPEGWLGFTFSLLLEQPWRAGGPEPVPIMVITQVHPASPAARAGLVPGDSIVSIDGRAVTSRSLATLQQRLEPGERVTLQARREGRTRTVRVEAGPRPPDEALVTIPLQVQVRLDSVQALLEERLRSVDRLTVMMDGQAQSMIVLRTMGDSLTAFAMRPAGAGGRGPVSGTFDVSWGTPPAPEPAPFAGVVEVRARQAPPAASDAATARAVVRAQDVEARVASARAVADAEAYKRPLAPYIVGQDWIAGARLTPMNPGLSAYFGVGSGLLVVDVAEGTPAADARLIPGDIIVATRGGGPLTDIEALRALLARARRPGEVPLTVVRRGLRFEVSLPH